MLDCSWMEAVYIQMYFIKPEKWDNRTLTEKRTCFGIQQFHGGEQAKDQVGR